MRDTADQDPKGARSAPVEVLVCRVHAQEFCIDVRSVKEIRGWAQIALLPNSPSYVLGVINLRGMVLPIVDVAARLNLRPGEETPRNVVIVVWIKQRLVGLLVDEVCDIVEIGARAMQPTPQLSCDTVQALVTALISVGDRVIGLLEFDQFLPEIDTGES